MKCMYVKGRSSNSASYSEELWDGREQSREDANIGTPRTEFSTSA